MKYISVEEASKKLNLSARSIRNYCAQGRFNGAILKGKTWLIPEDATKPTRINNKEDEEYLDSINEASSMIEYINNSPISFLAIDNIKRQLIKEGYRELKENKKDEYYPGEKVFTTRNDSTIIAFNIGKNINSDNLNFHIIASHSDSPCFKIKPNFENETAGYKKVNVAPYGGLIASTWFDRPLSIAGRVMVNNGNLVESKLINLSELTLFIPNLCIHFNSNINHGYEYDFQNDTQPFYSLNTEYKSVKELIAKKLKIKEEDIVSFDLYLYLKEKGILWGERNEFISSGRLDDLECVYTSLQAFLRANNDDSINVLYVADNEEVGSMSRQGANSDFLPLMIRRVVHSFKGDYDIAINNSFLISADNAHAVHPNKPSVTDSDNFAHMNKGVVIKFNASANSYTSDSLTSSIFQKLCMNCSTPYQFFTNRSDIRGGSTLGKYLITQISIPAVDIGLAQLAMHSSYETAGSLDVKYAINVFKEFYSSKIEFLDSSYKISKL